MNKKIIGLIVLAVCVIGVGIMSVRGSALHSGDGSIRIGFIAPLSGDAASYGEPIRKSVELAVAEVNAAGGVNGRPIRMIYEDGKCTGEGAASAAQKLVNVDHVRYIIGGACSSEVLSMIPVTDPAKVFVLSPSASASKITGISLYFARNNPSDSLSGSVLADYLAKSYKKVAIISEQSDMAQGIQGNFTSRSKENGLTVVSSESYSTGTTDFRTILMRVNATSPDVIFINPQTPQNVVRIAQQARQLDIDVPFAAGFMAADPSVAEAGLATDGMVFASLAGLTTPKGQEFVAKFKNTYHSDPNYPFYDGAGYDDVYLLAQAIAAVGDDSTKVAHYLYSLPSYTGAIGTYSFDKNGDIVGAGVVMERIEGGKVVEVNQ